MSHVPRRAAALIPTGGSLPVVVLIASIVVAAILAYQAITAARQRRAVSDAMLRQYAQLALWEFNRQARRDVDDTIMHTLSSYAHPPRSGHRPNDACNCEPLPAVDYGFEVLAGGELRARTGAIDSRVRDEIAAIAASDDREGNENAVHVTALPGDPSRFVAMKWERHIGPNGGQVGLVAGSASLKRLLERAYRRTPLLPAALVGNRDPRTLVDLRVFDAAGRTVFASRDGVAGPIPAESTFLPHLPLGLVARSTMSPEFIATLGPEHGNGSSSRLVVTLVLINAALVCVAIWQLARERELTRLRAGFVAGVSHELRTPLTQIRMFSETLLLERTRTPEERRRALEIIGQESQRLSQLVENVLHFHRQHELPAPSPGAALDLRTFAREVVESFQPLAASKRVRLAVSSAGEPVLVRADGGALRQVLLNLLDNAVKFGPAGQTVKVCVHSGGNEAALQVIDEGPGVPIADRERIFHPFERGRDTRGTGGAGIGLAVVAQVVAAHGGRITADDAPSGGARFTVHLPAVPADQRV